VLLALISFMPTPGEGAVGALDVPRAERQKLANRCAAGAFCVVAADHSLCSSPEWRCEQCGVCNKDILALSMEEDPERIKADQAAKEVAAKLTFRGRMGVVV
jgi:hypothetical protein